MKHRDYALLLLRIVLFSTVVPYACHAQDFLPEYFWYATSIAPDPQDYFRRSFQYFPLSVTFHSGIRERMMPNYVSELKKQGVSKEIQVVEGKIIANLYYNAEGLLTKYESDDGRYEIILEYGAGNTIKNMVERRHDQSVQTVIDRDTMMQISSVNIAGNLFNYSYDKSRKLIAINSKYPPITITYRSNNLYATPGASLAIIADSIVYDEFGRQLWIETGGFGGVGTNKYDKERRIVSMEYLGRQVTHNTSFKYKNNLLTKIVTQTTENYSGRSSKNVTLVKYEYGHKKKK